jgi:hypothetical protein
VGTNNYKKQPQLKPDGRYKLAWTLQPNVELLDVTTFGDTSRTYTTTTANGPTWWTDPKPKADGHRYSIEGEFQGELFSIEADLVMDSPVEAVMREVIGLYPGDELVSVAIRHADGTVTVRPWDEE